MNEIGLLEKTYRKFIEELENWSSESVIELDMDLLERLNLADTCYLQTQKYELNYSFQLLETEEKITLWNEKFVVWIVPENFSGQTATYILIALNKNPFPKLELVFLARGVFNSSQLILKVLEKQLQDIEENEGLLNQYSSLK